jgi:hypothetical protein
MQHITCLESASICCPMEVSQQSLCNPLVSSASVQTGCAPPHARPCSENWLTSHSSTDILSAIDLTICMIVRYNISPVRESYTVCRHNVFGRGYLRVTGCNSNRASGQRASTPPRRARKDPEFSPKRKRSLRFRPICETRIYQYSTHKKQSAYTHRKGTTHGCTLRGYRNLTRKSTVRSLRLMPGLARIVVCCKGFLNVLRTDM